MTWTYSLSNINSSALSFVRMKIGDTTSGDQLLQDEEIQALVTDVGDQYFAAARAARAIAGHFSRRTDKTAGRLRIAGGQPSQYYETLAQRLEMEAGMRVGPYAGALSISDKDSYLMDNDRVKPSFTIGMTDFPATIATTS